MRTRPVLGAALLVLALCASCGGGGAGGGAGGTPDANAATVGLTWTASDDAAGYVVHWGTTSGAYPHTVDVGDPGPDSHGAVTATIMLDGVDASAERLFFVITSYDGAGGSSAYSNELSIATSSLSIAPTSG